MLRIQVLVSYFLLVKLVCHGHATIGTIILALWGSYSSLCMLEGCMVGMVPPDYVERGEPPTMVSHLIAFFINIGMLNC